MFDRIRFGANVQLLYAEVVESPPDLVSIFIFLTSASS